MLMSVYKDLLELVGLSGAGRVISKLVTFTNAVFTVSSFFFRIPLDETIANTYFVAPFYSSGQLIHCLEISGNKNCQKIKNSQASAESYWFL